MVHYCFTSVTSEVLRTLANISDAPYLSDKAAKGQIVLWSGQGPPVLRAANKVAVARLLARFSE